MVKNPPANVGDAGSIPGSEDPLAQETATHSSIPAWQIPWTEEPDGLQSVGLQRIRQDLATDNKNNPAIPNTRNYAAEMCAIRAGRKLEEEGFPRRT